MILAADFTTGGIYQRLFSVLVAMIISDADDWMPVSATQPGYSSCHSSYPSHHHHHHHHHHHQPPAHSGSLMPPCPPPLVFPPVAGATANYSTGAMSGEPALHACSPQPAWSHCMNLLSSSVWLYIGTANLQPALHVCSYAAVARMTPLHESLSSSVYLHIVCS